MANNEKINNILDNVIGGLLQLKDALNENNSPPPVVTVQSTPTIVNESPDDDNFDSFESLKKALLSSRWPEAVNPRCVCNPDNETEVKQRGEGIIDLMIQEKLDGLKFLEIGCGAGYSVLSAIENGAAFAMGYDIKHNPKWESLQGERTNIHFTTDFGVVSGNAPYNSILMFDVIDHVQNETPVGLLKKAASVLAPDGKIYVRCHPFISRHGTHLYHELNKAYAHLVFTSDELRQILPKSKYEEKSIGVVYPIKTYQTMVESSGLKIISKNDFKQTVEPFFKIPKIAQRIMKNTKTTSFPEFQMGFQFYDMILQKA